MTDTQMFLVVLSVVVGFGVLLGALLVWREN